jgi:uncharacterized protein YndB with AHSA1/START domain
VSNIIEKEIDLKAPMSRVWKALTDYKEFSQWFRINLEGPFIVGQTTAGQNAWPKYEHIRIEFAVKALDPETYFAYTWHPYPMDPAYDYSQDTPTLVEFKLTPTATGTNLKVKESGFEKLPASRFADAFNMNTKGWGTQLTNIETYVNEHP